MDYGERIPTEWNVQLNQTNAHSVLQLDRIRLTLLCLRLSFCVVFLFLRCWLFSLFWFLSLHLIFVRPMCTLYAFCWRTFDACFDIFRFAGNSWVAYVCLCVFSNGLCTCACVCVNGTTNSVQRFVLISKRDFVALIWFQLNFQGKSHFFFCIKW